SARTAIVSVLSAPHTPPSPLHSLSLHDALPISGAQAQQAAQRHQPLVLVVDLVGVAAELLVLPGAGGVLEAEDGLRGEQVRLPLATPLVLPADGEAAVGGSAAVLRMGEGVTGRGLGGDPL